MLKGLGKDLVLTAEVSSFTTVALTMCLGAHLIPFALPVTDGQALGIIAALIVATLKWRME